MSIKTYLRAAMLKIGSTAGTPSAEVISIINHNGFTAEGGKASFEYVAPCDGELCIFLQCTGSNGVPPAVDLRINDIVRHTARTIDGSTWQMLRKGQKCIVSYFDATTLIEQWKVYFIKNEGSLV